MRILTLRIAILLGVFLTLVATADWALAANDAGEPPALAPTVLAGIPVRSVVASLARNTLNAWTASRARRVMAELFWATCNFGFTAAEPLKTNGTIAALAELVSSSCSLKWVSQT